MRADEGPLGAPEDRQHRAGWAARKDRLHWFDAGSGKRA